MTLAATIWWIAMVVALNDVWASDEQWAGWGMIGFIWLFAPVLGGLALLLGVVPGGIAFWRRRQRRDLWSLCLSAASLLVLAVEVAIFVIPAL